MLERFGVSHASDREKVARRRRRRRPEGWGPAVGCLHMSLSLSLYVYIYIYIYTHLGHLGLRVALGGGRPSREREGTRCFSVSFTLLDLCAVGKNIIIFIHLVVIKHISWILISILIYVICVIGCSIRLPPVSAAPGRGGLSIFETY